LVLLLKLVSASFGASVGVDMIFGLSSLKSAVFDCSSIKPSSLTSSPKLFLKN
jgi:hypothetical protein